MMRPRAHSQGVAKRHGIVIAAGGRGFLNRRPKFFIDTEGAEGETEEDSTSAGEEKADQRNNTNTITRNEEAKTNAQREGTICSHQAAVPPPPTAVIRCGLVGYCLGGG